MHLPIDPLVPEIVEHLRRVQNLVIEAAPGAGKTTRVPPALLVFGAVVVLEPRRIAARMAARRVALEHQQQAGATVGYQVRFENVTGPATRLRYVTGGILLQRLLRDPDLCGIAVVVLDEFHERQLDTDLALALLRRLQQTTRPDLRLVVMSATLDAEPVRAFLGDCPSVVSQGRLFDLQIVHVPYSAAPWEHQVALAAARLLDQPAAGDVLVFLPGAAEIRAAERHCEPLARQHNLQIERLHGDLSAAEQDRAVTPGASRKLILSTNIAESSITIDGVLAVIDSGLARIAGDSPWTGLPTLQVARISQAAATQRAGRAARTGPGQVIRLYTSEDFRRRPAQDQPEILRRELSALCLHLRATGIGDLSQLAWVDAPPALAVQTADALLNRLGARGDVARRMAQQPLHPRLARLLLEGARRGAGDAACAAAAMLSSGDRYEAPDLTRALERSLPPRTKVIYQQLRRGMRIARISPSPDALPLAVLAAFPDRAGRRGSPLATGFTVRLASGGSAASPEDPGAFLVAVDLQDRSEQPLPQIRLYAPIQPDWLLDLFPDRVRESIAIQWNRSAERVDAVSSLLYDELIITETRDSPPPPSEAAALLAAKAMEAGLSRFLDQAALDTFLARIDFATQHGAGVPLEPDAVELALRTVCQGLRSFAELKQAADGVLPALQRGVDMAAVERVAPSRVSLARGRFTPVYYEPGKPPWIRSRLQDFFGLRDGPRVAQGRVPVVLHLLAPNQRPVQTTIDLAGFWSRLYPQVRKELARRYPKHPWPENPLA